MSREYFIFFFIIFIIPLLISCIPPCFSLYSQLEILYHFWNNTNAALLTLNRNLIYWKEKLWDINVFSSVSGCPSMSSFTVNQKTEWEIYRDYQDKESQDTFNCLVFTSRERANIYIPLWPGSGVAGVKDSKIFCLKQISVIYSYRESPQGCYNKTFIIWTKDWISPFHCLLL